MTTGEIVSSVFLTRDQLLRMEKLTVRSCANLIDHCGLQVDEDTPGDVLARSSLREEGVEGIIATTNSFVRWHLTIWLNAVLQAEQLPACVTDLDTCLTEMNANGLTHLGLEEKVESKKL